jgi:hypothetical protein
VGTIYTNGRVSYLAKLKVTIIILSASIGDPDSEILNVPDPTPLRMLKTLMQKKLLA